MQGAAVQAVAVHWMHMNTATQMTKGRSPAPPRFTHLALSTVSANFKLWKYFCMALACCRWYSTVVPEGALLAASMGAAAVDDDATGASAASEGAEGLTAGLASSGSEVAWAARVRTRHVLCSNKEAREGRRRWAVA